MPYEKPGSITVTFQDGTEHEFTSIEKCAGLDPAEVVETDEVLGEISATSEYPVQSKVIHDALELKADLVDGKVPSSQLPSYVDDIEEYATVNDFPVTGEAGKIYVALDTGYTYRWSGTTYTQVGGGCTFQIFDASWPTTGTTKAFCDAVNADLTAVIGMAYLGGASFTDLPFVGNGDVIVEVLQGPNSTKAIHLVLTSGDIEPYRWEYTYWNDGSNVSGWIGFQPELISGTNIKTVNGGSLLGSGNIIVKAFDDFPASWNSYSGNTQGFCAFVAQDSSLIKGKCYLGALSQSNISDLPLNNGEVQILVVGGAIANWVLHLTLTSGDHSPYHWECTWWPSGWSGWIGFQPQLVSGTNIKTIENQSLLGSGNIDLTKSDVGLGNVDNTSDANKPISTATQTALDGKQATLSFNESVPAGATQQELSSIKNGSTYYTIDAIDAADVINILNYVVYEPYSWTYANYAPIPTSIEISSVSYPCIGDVDLDYWKVEGSSVVWNQTVSTSLILDTETVSGVTFTNNSDGTITITGTATDNIFEKKLFKSPYFSFVKNKKYLIYGLQKKTGLSYGIQGFAITNDDNFIFSYANDWQQSVSVSITNGTNFGSGLTIFPLISDLTKDYPTDTPTSVTDPRILAITQGAYDAGSLKSTVVEEIVAYGFNVWDEETRNGYYGNDGAFVSNANFRANKNPIPVSPNNTYYIYDGNTNMEVFFYDADNHFISKEIKASTKTFTTPNNCRYLCFSNQSSGTYPNKVCINISNASLNGQYKPYIAPKKIDLVALGLTEAQRTLRSAGTVRDYFEIAEEDGAYKLKKHVVIGDANLGSLAWTKENDHFYSNVINGIKAPAGGSTVANIACDKFVPDAVNVVTGDNVNKTIGVSIWSRVYLYDSAITSSSQISGTLFFELATPTTTTLIQDLTFSEASLPIELGGHFEVHNANESYGALPSLTTNIPVNTMEE